LSYVGRNYKGTGLKANGIIPEALIRSKVNGSLGYPAEISTTPIPDESGQPSDSNPARL